MISVARFSELRKRLGSDAFFELSEMTNERSDELRSVFVTSDFFERRLVEETSKLRTEIDGVRISMIRWMFGFFIGYLGVTISIVGLILHAAKLL